MAIIKNTNQATSTNNNNNEDVQGYLNIKVVDAQGNEHSLSRGIPLSIKRRLDKSIMAAVEADPNKEFKVVASVHLLNSDQESIEF